LVLNLDPNLAAAHPLARDVSAAGHWGVGNLELTLDAEETLEDVLGSSVWPHGGDSLRRHLVMLPRRCADGAKPSAPL